MKRKRGGGGGSGEGRLDPEKVSRGWDSTSGWGRFLVPESLEACQELPAGEFSQRPLDALRCSPFGSCPFFFCIFFV